MSTHHYNYPGIYTYSPVFAFNGTLFFKDFVDSDNWEITYNFFLASTKKQAPSFKIYTFSRSSLRTSIFVWTPGNQPPAESPYMSGQWATIKIGPNNGSTASWPYGPVGNLGWFCTYVAYIYDGGHLHSYHSTHSHILTPLSLLPFTLPRTHSQNCYLPTPLLPGMNAGAGTSRNLKTYADGLKNQPAGSAAQKAYDDTVIVGFQLGIGSGESFVTAFVNSVNIKYTDPQGTKWDWKWTF